MTNGEVKMSLEEQIGALLVASGRTLAVAGMTLAMLLLNGEVRPGDAIHLDLDKRTGELAFDNNKRVQ